MGIVFMELIAVIMLIVQGIVNVLMGNVWLLVNVKEVANIIKNVFMADALITVTMATTTFTIKNVMTEMIIKTMIKTTITTKMVANLINNVKRNNNARTAFA